MRWIFILHSTWRGKDVATLKWVKLFLKAVVCLFQWGERVIEAAIFIGTLTMTFNYETRYQNLTCSVFGVQVSLGFCVCVCRGCVGLCFCFVFVFVFPFLFWPLLAMHVLFVELQHESSGCQVGSWIINEGKVNSVFNIGKWIHGSNFRTFSA